MRGGMGKSDSKNYSCCTYRIKISKFNLILFLAIARNIGTHNINKKN